MYKMSEMAKYDPPVVSTIETHANHLLGYLRWIEHSQSQGHDIHELCFPEDAFDRVTYIYHRYLKRLLRKTPPPLSLSVAKTRMSVVVNFYKTLIVGNIIGESQIDNPPYESKLAGIPWVTSTGLMRIKQVETTDLTIRKPRHNPNAEPGYLSDGGKLRPIPPSDQKIICDALSTYGNRAFELIMLTALTTGARKQTVCTLRVEHIKSLLDKSHRNKKELLLKVGVGTSIDVKQKSNSKSYRLHIPRPLAEKLVEYANSSEARSRRRQSWYGDTDNNYLFLSEKGTPYYTSKAEIQDRQNPAYSSRISFRDRVDFTLSEGRSLNNLVARLIKKIRLDYPEFRSFRFHDTRSTYGMNFVRHFIREGKSPDFVVDQLRIRMGHSNIQTTYSYLNFDHLNEQIEQLEDAYMAFLSALTPRY